MSKPSNVHPEVALFSGGKTPPSITVCDHYAGSEKLIQKSLTMQAERGPLFDITCDLEDGAQVGNEKQRREMALTFICSTENRFNLVGLRVNDFRNDAWRTDMQEALRLAGDRLAHLTIPKVERVSELKVMLAYLEDCHRRLSMKRRIPVHVLIETHGAVREAWEIASLPEIRGLDFGLMDFVSEHQGVISSTAMYSPGQFEHALVIRAKTELAAAACAHGKIAAHNVTPQFKDVSQTKQDALIARRRFGFSRMWSIHPSQIDAILEGMRPDQDEVTLAGEILLSAAKAEWAPISHREKLHDRASYRYYWNVLTQAKQAGMILDPAVLQAFFA
ncbi:MAG: CoA ester lyase [Deltaproteobacteria bacterium]|nr:CoA ester lyase [Deltaproteobacteria bacterium]